jgi:RNA recognition motif-containing protein
MSSNKKKAKIPFKNRKGIIFLHEIPLKISFESISLFFGKFGSIDKSFFLSITDYKEMGKRKIIGLIEYTDKIKAKKTAYFFRNLRTKFFGLRVKYLRNIPWENLRIKYSF